MSDDVESVDELAAQVRNHAASVWDGEDSQEDVIRTLLEQELARLDEESDRNEEAAQKRAELRADLGLSADEELGAEEATDAVTDKQEAVRERILGR